MYLYYIKAFYNITEIFIYIFLSRNYPWKQMLGKKWVKSIFPDTWTLLLSYHRILCCTFSVWLFCPSLKSTVQRGIRTDGYWIHRVLCMYVCTVWGRKKFILLHSIGCFAIDPSFIKCSLELFWDISILHNYFKRFSIKKNLFKKNINPYYEGISYFDK